MANKNEHMPKYGDLTGLLMNLVGNDSMAWLYIIPSVVKIEKAAAINRWIYPVRRFRLRNYDYLGLSFIKEVHVRQSTEGFPCSETDEEIYYEVRLDKFTLYDT